MRVQSIFIVSIALQMDELLQITVQSKGDNNFYYIEFINPSSSDTTFFGKF